MALNKEKGEEVDRGDDVCCKRDRMLFLGNVAFFRCYFTERRNFNGISLKQRSFDAMRPNFPLASAPYRTQTKNEHCLHSLVEHSQMCLRFKLMTKGVIC